MAVSTRASAQDACKPHCRDGGGTVFECVCLSVWVLYGWSVQSVRKCVCAACACVLVCGAR